MAGHRTSDAQAQRFATEQFDRLFLFALVWNGVVSIFAWEVIGSFHHGDPEWFDWLYTILLIPLGLIGLLMMVFLIYSCLALFNPRPMLTLSSGSLSLGESLTVSWRFSRQTGSIRRLRIVLKGEEIARCRRLRNNHTDSETFVEVPVIDTTDSFEIFTGMATVIIPVDSMYSSESVDNTIIWSVNVEGRIGKGAIGAWPDIHASYPFVVLPKTAQGVG